MAATPVEKAHFRFLTPKLKHGHQPHYGFKIHISGWQKLNAING
jgi:hypothetical protein